MSSPVMRIYRDWETLSARLVLPAHEAPGAWVQACAQRDEARALLMQAASRSAADLAAKVIVDTDFGAAEISAPLVAEVKRLVRPRLNYWPE